MRVTCVQGKRKVQPVQLLLRTRNFLTFPTMESVRGLKCERTAFYFLAPFANPIILRDRMKDSRAKLIGTSRY